MLTSLYIRDFAIIKSIELEVAKGLTVMTGETGAGKSILIDALALVLGGRADAGCIRHGALRADVTASFMLKNTSDALKWLREHDLDSDHDCVLRRVIEAERGSKGFINGRPVPMQMLRELGEHLVDIHGQHEHQSLLKRDAQRQILDDYAGIGDAVAEVTRYYESIRSTETRLHALNRESADRDARLALLRHQVKELESLNLAADEVPALEDEHGRLANGTELLEGAQAAVQGLSEDDESAIAPTLAQITRKLETLAHHDPALGEIAGLLNEASIQIGEASSRLNQYLANLDLDPERLHYLDNRLAAIHDLARKHRVRPEELPQVLQRLQTELGDTEDLEGNLTRLNEQLEEARGAYATASDIVSKSRAQAAKKLSRAVTERMQELGMTGGRFEVDLATLPAEEIGPHGRERIEFLVSANTDQPARALAKVASGGELSRISLALQVVTAALGRIPTLIFDEVDVGVGGRVAEIVGQQLRKLGGSRQVLCITHLPQVAALGDHHLRILKRAESGGTHVDVEPLKATARVQEIARMLGGIEINKKTIAHAEDMLSRATA